MEKVAIVGDKGSGKTSLLRSLFCLVEVESGCIKIDNVDISQVEPRHLRSQLSIIPQDQVIFSGILFSFLLLNY
mgnify:CR=1 FL=1